MFLIVTSVKSPKYIIFSDVCSAVDIIEDLYSPRTASMDFVNELVRKRGKDNLPKFVQFVVGIFRRYCLSVLLFGLLLSVVSY